MANSVKTEKAPKPSFFKGVKSEFHKVNWPDRDSVVKQSVSVVCISIVMGVIISVFDLIFQYGVDFLTKL